MNAALSSRRTVAFAALLAVSALVLLAGVLMQVCLGAYPVPLARVLDLVAGRPVPEEMRDIVLSLRLPRAVAGILVGVNLSLAGAVFQTITRNEMASPYLLGVSQGSGLVISLVVILCPTLLPVLPLVAMVGGVAAFFVVYAIAWDGAGASPVRLVLAGVIFGAVTGGVQSALTYFVDDIQTARNASTWLAGSLVGSDWSDVRTVLPWTLVAFLGIVVLSRHLDMLLLGEQEAVALGVPVNRIRFVLALFAVLASASAVAAAGLVGFVGLIVPHVVRAFTGPRHARLLVGCAVAGPALLVVADAGSRLLLSPLQLPVGIVTGAVGGVFFLFLMKRGRRTFSAGGGRRD